MAYYKKKQIRKEALNIPKIRTLKYVLTPKEVSDKINKSSNGGEKTSSQLTSNIKKENEK